MACAPPTGKGSMKPGENRGSETRIPARRQECPARRQEVETFTTHRAGTSLHGSFTDSTAVASAVVLCYYENTFCRKSQVRNGGPQHIGLSTVHTDACKHRDDAEWKTLELTYRNPGLLAHLNIRVKASRRAIPHPLRSAGKCPTMVQATGTG